MDRWIVDSVWDEGVHGRDVEIVKVIRWVVVPVCGGGRHDRMILGGIRKVASITFSLSVSQCFTAIIAK